MTLEEFKKLLPEEKAKFETERIGCNGAKMIGIGGHSCGTLHTLCPECGQCHDCDEGE